MSDMFCFQCQQTAGNKCCVSVGVCGKQPDTAALQDELVYELIRLAEAAAAAGQRTQIADRLLMEGGRWSAAQVKEAFQRDSLREFTGPFRRAVVQARETLNGGNDPQLADFVLDRAYFAEMAETARAVGSPFLEGYVRLLIDAACAPPSGAPGWGRGATF